MVQWLEPRNLTAGGTGSVPGWGTKIPQTKWLGQKKRKRKTEIRANKEKATEKIRDSEGIKTKLQKTKNHKRSYYIHETMEAMRTEHLKDERETENLLKELKDKLENSLSSIIAVAS